MDGAGLRIAATADRAEDLCDSPLGGYGGYPGGATAGDGGYPSAALSGSPALSLDEEELPDFFDRPRTESGEASEQISPKKEAAWEGKEAHPDAKPKCRKRHSDFFKRLLLLPPLTTLMERHHFAARGLSHGTLQGRVQVLRAGGFKRPRYGLYVTPPGGEEVLLIAAERQRQLKFGPYYVISSNGLDFDRESMCFLGRLSGNAVCTHYLLHGQRISGHLREELCALRFRKPSDAPRRMAVVFPDATSSFSSRSGQEGQLMQAAEGRVPGHQFHCMTNTSPVWDANRKVYRMNFHNRVHRASSKNFQLVKSDVTFQAQQPEQMAMQFGRIDETSFAFDVTAPLSPLQAFAVALSVFDDRVYEALRIYY